MINNAEGKDPTIMPNVIISSMYAESKAASEADLVEYPPVANIVIA